MKLSVIIPAFNEEKTLVESVTRLLETGYILDVEVVIVDDGSIDSTYVKAKELAAKYPCITVLKHDNNCGKGAAIATAKNIVSGDFVVIHDADLEYDPRNFKYLIEKIVNPGVSIVYGSRFLKDNPNKYPVYLLGNKFMTLMFNMVFHAGLTDVYTCYKMFKRDVWDKIVITSKGFEIELELTARAIRLGINIVEVPIDYSPRTLEDGKKIGLRDVFTGLWKICSICLKK
ncbi:MAG: glycosyltransferase family 2 protein [Elusimicrobiota bacterium]